MDKKYQIISVDGKFINKADFRLSIDNRAFRFGDGLFETMHANGTEIQFLNEHYNRLLKGAKGLRIELPTDFSIEYVRNLITGLLNRCKLYQGAKVRMMVYRSGAGLFIPESNAAVIVVEAEYLGKGPYELNENGIVIDINPEPVCSTSYSGFKSMNSLPYVLAGVFAKENGFDDVLLCNARNQIIEATSSNIFCFKGKDLFTPGLESGCVEGVMRSNIIRIGNELNYNVYDNHSLKAEDLLEMDEVFLTNAISGIKWVTGFRDRRYYKRYLVKLLRALNNSVFD